MVTSVVDTVSLCIMRPAPSFEKGHDGLEVAPLGRCYVADAERNRQEGGRVDDDGLVGAIVGLDDVDAPAASSTSHVGTDPEAVAELAPSAVERP